MGACTNNSTPDNNRGGNGGDTDDNGGNGGSSDSQGGTGGAGGTTAQGGSAAGGSAGNAGGVGGSTNQGGIASTTRPTVENKGKCVPPRVKLTKVGTAFEPMQVTQGKGDDFMLVAERSGKIQRLKDGKIDGPPFANFAQSVHTAGDDNTSERGLLGLALHPDYENNGRFFLFYNRRERDPFSEGKLASVVIAEGKRSAGDKTKAEPKLTALVVSTVQNDHHIGGFLGVGRDGYLYAGLGDGGGSEDDDSVRGAYSRNFADLRAKVLRIDVNAPTRKVEGNLDRPGAAPQVWVYGVRNPFRGSFDSATGDLYLGDVGEFSYEEINYVEFGKQPDPDFGWYLISNETSRMEGTLCGGVTRHNKQTGMEGFAAVPWLQHFEPKIFGHLPIKVIPHTGAGSVKGECSWMMKGMACFGGNEAACARAIIGGVVYRGKKIPDLDGRYIYGEHMKNTVDSLIVKDGVATCDASLTADLTAGTHLQGITSFGTDKDDEVYITDLAGNNIYRIDPK